MAPAPWAAEAAAMARANPNWCIGAHLTTLGEWQGYRLRPVLPYDKVKTLVDEGGFLHQTPEGFFAKGIDYDQLEREFTAQINLIANYWSVDLSYVDFHYIDGTQHNAPEYKQVLQRVAKAFKLPLCDSMGERRFSSIYETAPGQKKAKFITSLDALKPGLWLSEHHVLRDDAEAWALRYGNVTDEPPEGVAAHRIAEAAVLTDSDVKDRVKALGINLVSYRDII